MKGYLSTFAVGLILYAAPGYSQTAQFKDSTTPASPGLAAEPSAPPLNYCMIEIQSSNSKGVKSAEEWSSGCERRIDIYCKTHDTGDEDDTPANHERDHMLSACNHISSAAACKRAFRQMCSALASWQAANP
jgi:hypothetical protein